MVSKRSLNSLNGVFMKILDVIAWVLLIVGGLNWGLTGVFQCNLVDAIFGAGSALSTLVYALVGLSALWCIFRCKSMCSSCKK